MKIIHEITSPMQVVVGASPIRNYPGIAGYNGMRVDVLMATSPVANFPDNARIYEPEDTEIIAIEGDVEYVLDILRQVLSALDDTKKHYQENMGRKRAMSCPNCEKPDIEGTDDNGHHTFECQAKWSNRARQVLIETPDLASRQADNQARAAERIAHEHTDCGGAGCEVCRYTGLTLEVAGDLMSDEYGGGLKQP